MQQHQWFRQMVIADLKGEATPEETSMLSLDENVEAWVVELEGYLHDLDAEIKRRKNTAFLLKDTSNNHAEVHEAFQESIEFEALANKLKTAAKRRLVTAKQLKHQKHLRDAQKHSSALESKRAKRDEKARKALWERNYLRATLHDVRRFLEKDELFQEESLPSRDTTLKKVEEVLFREASEEAS